MSPLNDTKERMVAGATTLMRRHGFGATSFKDVWEFTDTPRGSVYFHFPDGKQQLGVAVIDRAVATLLEWTDRAAANSVGAADFVVALGRELAGFLESNGYDEGCPIASIAIEMSPSSPALREASRAAFGSWSERVASVVTDRGVGAEEARDFATAATAAFEGAILVSKSDGHRRTVELVARMLARALPA